MINVHGLAHRGTPVIDYPVGAAPDAGNFPPHSRIVSSMSLAVLAVEPGETCGALIIALPSLHCSKVAKLLQRTVVYLRRSRRARTS